MTREEIQKLPMGTKLRLPTGDIIEVESVGEQKIKFQYETMPQSQASSLEAPTTFVWGTTGVMRGNIGGKLIGPAPSELSFAAIEAEVKLQGTYPTTVTCDWIELVNAVRV